MIKMIDIKCLIIYIVVKNFKIINNIINDHLLFFISIVSTFYIHIMILLLPIKRYKSNNIVCKCRHRIYIYNLFNKIYYCRSLIICIGILRPTFFYE